MLCQSSPSLLLPRSSFLPPPLRRRAVRPQPRAATPSVPCRTSTATLCGECSLPDLLRSSASLCGQCSLPDLNCDLLCTVFLGGPQPRPSAECSLPDLHREPLRPVFPAGPQLRPAARSDPCRTSTATLCGQCSLRGLNCDLLCPVIPAGPQPRPSALSVPCRTSTAR